MTRLAMPVIADKRATGTRYYVDNQEITGAVGTSVPAPTAEGSLVISDAALQWIELAHPAAAFYHLETDGDTAAWQANLTLGDDAFLYFGAGPNSAFEYDTGTSTLRITGANIHIDNPILNVGGTIGGGGERLAVRVDSNAPTGAEIVNADVNAAALATLRVKNTAGAGPNHSAFVHTYGTGFTTTGLSIQDSAQFGAGASLSGGLVIRTLAATPIILGVDTDIEAARIISTGEFGVGTPTPATDLDVGGISPTYSMFGAAVNAVAVGGDVTGVLAVEGSSSANIWMNDSGGTADQRLLQIQVAGEDTFFTTRNDDGTLRNVIMQFRHVTGDVIVGNVAGAALGQLHIAQNGAAGNQPVLKLFQNDISEECINFDVGAGADVYLWSVLAAGIPTLLWDGSEDAYSWNKGHILTAGALDLSGLADVLVLDADGDTTISAPTDDQIDFEVGGSDVVIMDPSGLGIGIVPTESIHAEAATGVKVRLVNTGDDEVRIVADANRTSADVALISLDGYWDGDHVGVISIEAGDDTINKDDGRITFFTSDAGGAAGLTHRMRIEANGRVGIGTESPSTRLDIDAGAMEFAEMTAPAAGAANTARLFARDNGAGKTQLCVRFNSGAIQVLATEP